MKRKVLLAIAWALTTVVGFSAVSVASSQPNLVLYYDTEDFSVSPEQKDYLDSHIAELSASKTITIWGFVQDSPPELENRGPANLSYKRAQMVENYIRKILKENSKNKATHVYVVVGKGQPPFDFTLKDARRVEVFLSN